MDLALLGGTYALTRLDRDAVPPALPRGRLSALVRDRAALTLIGPDESAPVGGETSGGWRALEVAGPLDLALTGVLARLAAPLHDAGIPIFVVSSYDTDFVLVPGDRLGEATTALQAAGHALVN